MKIERRLKAPVTKVFAAWTEADRMVKWYCPAGFEVVKVVSEPHVGGAFRVEMQAPDGTDCVKFGEYLEVVPNEKIVLSWGWVDEPEVWSRVEITFVDLDGETDLTLHHEQFPSVEERDSHNWGWTGAMENLARFVG